MNQATKEWLKKYLRNIIPNVIAEPQVIKSKACEDKTYCSELTSFKKVCEGKQIQRDCPNLCQKCKPCTDDSACRFISDIENVCKSHPHIQSLCSKTCNKCIVQANKIGK